MSATVSAQTEEKSSIRPLLIVALLMVVGFALAYPGLFTGIWVDECYSINSATAPDLVTMIKHMYGRLDDLHPPLSYVMLYAFMHAFGTSDVLIRIPPLICGLLLIPAVYWLGVTAHSRTVGLLAAWFAAVSPFATYYACQSRGYAMATLFASLALTFFCKLINPLTEKKTIPFVGFVLTAAALCYSEYPGCIMLPALAIATVIIAWQNKSNKTLALDIFKRGAVSIFIAALLFVPWLPSLQAQSRVAMTADRTPISQFFPVFGYNMAMMLPIPLILGIPLAELCIVIWLAYTARHWQRYKSIFSMERINAIPSNMIVLWTTLLIATSLMGYVGPFFYGYYRYIYPFSPAGWVLLAIMLRAVFLKMRESKRKIVVPLLLLAMLGLNIAYAMWFDSRPQSGLRTVAQEALKGEYDHTIIMMAPDVITPTLDYYLRPEERIKHHILIVGFPRFDDPFSTVWIPELAKWKSETVVDETDKRISELVDKGWKYLAFTKDSDSQIQFLTTKDIPRMPRIKALKAIMDKKYKLIKTKSYAGVTENVTVFTYQLRP